MALGKEVRAVIVVAIDPWERQPGETGRQFQAFQIYRDADANERSLAKVAQTLGIHTTQVARWSSPNGWVARAAAWDVEKDRIKRIARAKEIEQMSARQAAAGAIMQTKGLGRIRGIIDRFDRDGNEVELRPGQMYSDGLSISEATRLVTDGVRMERIGRGEGDPYTPQITTNITNQVLQISVGAFMRANPTKVGPTVELLEQLADMMDNAGPKLVGPPLEDDDDGRATGEDAGDASGSVPGGDVGEPDDGGPAPGG